MTPSLAAASRYARTLGGGTASITISNLLARFFGLIVSFVAAALLQPERLGEFALLTISAAFLGAVGVLGFGPLASRAIAHAPVDDSAVAIATFVFRTCLGLLLALAACVFLTADPSLGITTLPGAGSRGAVAVVAIWGIGVGLNPLLMAIAAGHKAFGTCSVANLSRAVAVGLGTTIGCLGSGTALGAAIGAAAGELVLAVALAVYTWRRGWLALSGRQQAPPDRGRFLRQAGVAGAASLMIQFSMWAGQMLLSRTPDGLVASGAFLLATRLVLLVTLVPNALATTALPILADHQLSDEIRQGMRRRILRFTILTAVPTAVLVALLGVIVLPTISDEYLAYRSTVTLVAAVGALMALNNVLGSIAVAERRIGGWILSDWVLAAILLGVGALTVRSWGAPGLAIAYFVAYAASVAVLRFDRRVEPNHLEVSR